MDTVGYCTIRKGATTGKGDKLDSFMGKDCRVLEFADDGGVLVINQESSSIATFDKADVSRSFKCKVIGDIICSPELNEVEQIIYTSKVMGRKGGYNQLLKSMVIQAGLMKGKFNDTFLFQNQ